jgi:hypothetical protein
VRVEPFARSLHGGLRDGLRDGKRHTGEILSGSGDAGCGMRDEGSG